MQKLPRQCRIFRLNRMCSSADRRGPVEVLERAPRPVARTPGAKLSTGSPAVGSSDQLDISTKSHTRTGAGSAGVCAGACAPASDQDRAQTAACAQPLVRPAGQVTAFTTKVRRRDPIARPDALRIPSRGLWLALVTLVLAGCAGAIAPTTEQLASAVRAAEVALAGAAAAQRHAGAYAARGDWPAAVRQVDEIMFSLRDARRVRRRVAGA